MDILLHWVSVFITCGEMELSRLVIWMDLPLDLRNKNHLQF